MTELTHMRTFLAVYRSGALTQAARILRVSQPAVSQQLKALEEELGERLFVRGPRGVTPTPAAHALAQDIAGPLDTLERVARRRRHPTKLRERVRFGGPIELLQSAALPALVGLIEKGLRLEALAGPDDDLLDALRAGEVDFVIAPSSADLRELRCVFLFEDELVMVSAPRWTNSVHARRLASTGAAALADLPLVRTRDPSDHLTRYVRETLDTELADAPAVVMPDLRGVLAVAIAGGGVAVLPRSLVQPALDSGSLVEWVPPRSPPTISYCLATLVEGPRPSGVAAAVEELLSDAREWTVSAS